MKTDLSSGILQVVCQEAVAAKRVPVVTETLQMLHDRVTASKNDSRPGEEACILRNLIQITAGKPHNHIPYMHHHLPGLPLPCARSN